MVKRSPASSALHSCFRPSVALPHAARDEITQSACGSTGVLLVPKAAGLRLGLDSYGAITVPTDGVRVAASSAVNAGARKSLLFPVPRSGHVQHKVQVSSSIFRVPKMLNRNVVERLDAARWKPAEM